MKNLFSTDNLLLDDIDPLPQLVQQELTKATGKWTAREHAIFLAYVPLRPSISWIEISRSIGTRTPDQTRSHAQKYFQKLKQKQRPQKRKYIPTTVCLPQYYYPPVKRFIRFM